MPTFRGLLHTAFANAMQAINNRGTPHILSSLLSSWHKQDHRQAPKQLSGRQLLQPIEQQDQATLDAAALVIGVQQAACNTTAEQGTCTEACSLSLQCQGGQSQHMSQFLRQEQRCAPASGVMLQVPVQRMHCSTFGELFRVLLQQHGMLCCGLYRQASLYGNPLWYVYTNPQKVRGVVTCQSQ
jgi:hypothetical protein